MRRNNKTSFVRTNVKQIAAALLSGILLSLLTGCVTLSPVSVKPAQIPTLPPEFRQLPPGPECQPSCLEKLKLDYERWLELLTKPADAAPAAKPTTTR